MMERENQRGTAMLIWFYMSYEISMKGSSKKQYLFRAMEIMQVQLGFCSIMINSTAYYLPAPQKDVQFS